jgi:hypothetical protein
VNPNFNNLGRARPNMGGNYFDPNFSGLVVIDRLFGQVSQKTNAFQVICEMRILESNLLERHPVGGSGSFVISFDNVMAQANYTGLLCAALGIDPRDAAAREKNITPEVGEFAINPQNPMRARVLRLRTELKPTKKVNGVVTVHYWDPVDQAQYAEKAKQLLESPVVSGTQAPVTTQAAPQGFHQPPAGFQLPQGYQQAAPAGFPQQAAPQGYQPPQHAAPAGFQLPQGFPQQAAPAGYALPQGFPQPSVAPQQAAPQQTAPAGLPAWLTQQAPQQAAPPAQPGAPWLLQQAPQQAAPAAVPAGAPWAQPQPPQSAPEWGPLAGHPTYEQNARTGEIRLRA